MQHYGGPALDAALLLLLQTGFLPPEDRRIHGTIAAIERELKRHGFVLRYSADEVDDGLEGGEGAFLACSFWLAYAYVMTGRFDVAVEMFERRLGVRNDLGLLAEEYDPVARRQLGNLPQGFSHIGLVNTAFNLVQAHGPAEQRAQRETLRVPINKRRHDAPYHQPTPILKPNTASSCARWNG